MYMATISIRMKVTIETILASWDGPVKIRARPRLEKGSYEILKISLPFLQEIKIESDG